MVAQKNIVLVGFMGTGKSSVGKIVAETTGRKLVEMDALIEKQEGMMISAIFAGKGEKYFRDKERKVVQELSAKCGLVISTGGGVVLNAENIADFKKNGIVICLSATPETIFERVKNETHRPLLKTKDPLAKIKELLGVRAPFYARADVTITTDGKKIEQIADEVVQAAR